MLHQLDRAIGLHKTLLDTPLKVEPPDKCEGAECERIDCLFRSARVEKYGESANQLRLTVWGMRPACL